MQEMYVKYLLYLNLNLKGKFFHFSNCIYYLFLLLNIIYKKNIFKKLHKCIYCIK